MMAKKANVTPAQKEPENKVVAEGKSKQRIQTAEGWKRSQLKQRKQSKD